MPVTLTEQQRYVKRSAEVPAPVLNQILDTTLQPQTLPTYRRLIVVEEWTGEVPVALTGYPVQFFRRHTSILISSSTCSQSTQMAPQPLAGEQSGLAA